MRRLLHRAHWLLLGVIATLTVASLWAQEAARQERGLTINQGNLTVTRGVAILSTGVFTNRSQQVVNGVGVTYTAKTVRNGYVNREGAPGNVTDALPTAANLVAELPSATIGSSFWFVLNNNDTADDVTLNGASTGVTYDGNCGTALATGEAMAVLILFTNVTSGSEAYLAVCLEH